MQNKVNSSNTKNVLYVSDLPQNVNEFDLQMLFQDYSSSIVLVNIVGSGFSKAKSAKVIFKDDILADQARKQTNMRKIKGRTVRVMWDEKDNISRYNSRTNVFVKNIAFDVKPREFYETFLEFGDIVSSKMPEDEDGTHLGYGYINYVDPISAAEAIKATNDKVLWGSKLEVKLFQKKNERLDSVLSNSNNSLYLKNFPVLMDEKQIKKVCESHGKVTYCKVQSDQGGRVHAIVSYETAEESHKAKSELNGQKFGDGSELFVDSLMNKVERKIVLMSKIKDTSNKLNEQYKLCNLHIKNIPYHAKEEDLKHAFEKFGDIKSVKIENLQLVTKVNDEFKTFPTSRGFGYVCFEEPESAAKAIEEMNHKFLPNYETWKRPLLVDYFQPKFERGPLVENKINRMNFLENKIPMSGINQMVGYNYPENMLQYNHMIHQSQIYKQPPQNLYQNKLPVKQKPKFQPPPIKDVEIDEIDYAYIDSLEDVSSKKDYVGELIFKKIENHEFAQMNSFSIDTIGRITGMILGIEDINEIVDIYKQKGNLTLRIKEAMELLGL
jgi:polyadenylate-binding protein